MSLAPLGGVRSRPPRCAVTHCRTCILSSCSKHAGPRLAARTSSETWTAANAHWIRSHFGARLERCLFVVLLFCLFSRIIIALHSCPLGATSLWFRSLCLFSVSVALLFVGAPRRHLPLCRRRSEPAGGSASARGRASTARASRRLSRVGRREEPHLRTGQRSCGRRAC